MEAASSGGRAKTRAASGRLAPGLRVEPAAFLFVAPSLVLFAVFVFWPLARTVYLSFHGSDIVGRPTIFVGLDQYQLMFSSPTVRDVLANTFVFSLLTVAPTLALAVVIALLLQQRIAGIGVFRTLMATPFAFSVATASVVFAIFFNPGVGVFNSFLQLFGQHPVGWLTDPSKALASVAATTIWLQLGYCVLVLSAGLGAIPEELYEAARLDGARALSITRHVTLPLLTPTLFFLLVVTTITSLQSFGQIHILTRGGPAGATTTLVYSVYVNAFAFGNSNFGLASAQALLLFVVVLAVTTIQFGVLERRVFYR